MQCNRSNSILFINSLIATINLIEERRWRCWRRRWRPAEVERFRIHFHSLIVLSSMNLQTTVSYNSVATKAIFINCQMSAHKIIKFEISRLHCRPYRRQRPSNSFSLHRRHSILADGRCVALCEVCDTVQSFAPVRKCQKRKIWIFSSARSCRVQHARSLRSMLCRKRDGKCVRCRTAGKTATTAKCKTIVSFYWLLLLRLHFYVVACVCACLFLLFVHVCIGAFCLHFGQSGCNRESKWRSTNDETSQKRFGSER